MRRKLNVRLLAIVFGTLLIVGVGVHFLHAFQLRQNAYRLLERGDRALAAKEYDKALDQFGQYLSFVPDDPDAVQKYAQALDARASTDAERERLTLLMEKVLRVKPNEHAFRMRLVHNLIDLERIPEAIDNLRKLQANWADKAELLHMLGWCYEAKKDYAEAVLAFEEAIKLNPKRIETYSLLAEVLHDRRGLPDDATVVLDAMLAANTNSHQAHLVRAYFLRKRGDDKAADRDLSAAFKLAPDRPEVFLAVADAERARGNWDEASRLLQEGLKKHPDRVDIYKLLVDVKLNADRRGEAIDVARAGLDRVPKSNELAVLLIDLMIDEKHYGEARQRIDQLMKAGMKATLPNYLRARLHMIDDEWSDAIQLLEQARRDLGARSEWNGRVNVLLGICFRNIGDPDLELEAFQRAVEEEPTWPPASIGLASALLSRGRADEACRTLELVRSAKNLPASYWTLLARGQIARQMRLPEGERNFDAVEEGLENAEKSGPPTVDLTLAHAELLAARGDVAGAQALLEKARSEHSNEIAIRIALAELAGRQQRFDDADKILAAATDIGDRLELRLAKCRLFSIRGNAADRDKLARIGDYLPSTFTADQRVRLNRTLADAWQRLGAADRAEKVLREVARALPKDLRSRSLLLELALEKQQPAAARVWLEQLRSIEGEAGWRWRVGAIEIQILEARGQRAGLAEARSQLLEFAALNKNSPRVPLLAATIADQEGHYPQAILDYSHALDMGEMQPRMMKRLLQLLMERREFAKAEAELGKYEQRLPLTSDLARLGAEIAVGMRDRRYHKLAIARAEQAVSLPARDYRDLLWLARIYHAAGNNAKAEPLLREGMATAGHAPDVWIAWMNHLAITNQRDQAAPALEKMKKEVNERHVSLTLARCYDALRQPVEAADAFKEAVSDRTGDFAALAFAADFHRRAEHADEAFDLYVRLLDPARAAPAEFSVPARRHLAVLLSDKGTAEARAGALELLDENQKLRGPNSADARIRLFVQSRVSKAARETALAKFQDSLRELPPTPDERVLLARMFEAANQFNQARTQLAEAADENPTSPQYLAFYANILIRCEDLDEAARQLTRLEALEPASERTNAVRQALKRAP